MGEVCPTKLYNKCQKKKEVKHLKVNFVHFFFFFVTKKLADTV